jgi:hypothetical protein
MAKVSVNVLRDEMHAAARGECATSGPCRHCDGSEYGCQECDYTGTIIRPAPAKLFRGRLLRPRLRAER